MRTDARHQDDPISPNDLAQYNGLDPEKPIYIAIKGRVFDVTAKREMYGKDKGYNVFAGKDASKGLGEFIQNFLGKERGGRRKVEGGTGEG